MKKVPIRTCIVCRKRKPKRELARIIASADEGLTYDLTGKKNGRGAYVCPDKACIDKLNAGMLGAALKQKIDPDDLETVKENINKEIQLM